MAEPTTYPTPYPTRFAPGPNLDAYFILDQSRSILYANGKCQDQNGKSCWVLSVDFIDLTQQQLAARVGGYYDPTTGHGLRVYLATFTCLNLQPIFKLHLQLDGDPTQITNVLNEMRGMEPKYGTCPSLGLKNIRESIALHKSDVRFNQAVTIISDGRVSEIDINPTIKASYNIALTGGIMWAAAVGQGINNEMLVKICDGAQDHVVQVSDYFTLASPEAPQGGVFRIALGMDIVFNLSAPTQSPTTSVVTAQPTVALATPQPVLSVTTGAPSLTSSTSTSPSVAASSSPSLSVAASPSVAASSNAPVAALAADTSSAPTQQPAAPPVASSSTTTTSSSSSGPSSTTLGITLGSAAAAGVVAALAAGAVMYRRKRTGPGPSDLVAFPSTYFAEDQPLVWVQQQQQPATAIAAAPAGGSDASPMRAMRRRSRGPSDIERGLPALPRPPAL